MRDLPPTVQMPALDALLGPMLQAPDPRARRRRRTRRPLTARLLPLAAAALALLAVLFFVVSSGPRTGPVPATTTPATALDRCEADLRAEHARWSRDPSREINPSSCDQPAVSSQDYVRLFTEVGGAVWTAAPTGTSTSTPEVP